MKDFNSPYLRLQLDIFHLQFLKGDLTNNHITDESINDSSDFKSLDVIISNDNKDNRNVDVSSESITYAPIIGDKGLHSDTSTSKIYSDDTQKLSNENYSLLIAETLKLLFLVLYGSKS